MVEINIFNLKSIITIIFFIILAFSSSHKRESEK